MGVEQEKDLRLFQCASRTYLSILMATRFSMEAVEQVTSTATNISQVASPSSQTPLTWLNGGREKEKNVSVSLSSLCSPQVFLDGSSLLDLKLGYLSAGAKSKSK